MSAQKLTKPIRRVKSTANIKSANPSTKANPKSSNKASLPSAFTMGATSKESPHTWDLRALFADEKELATYSAKSLKSAQAFQKRYQGKLHTFNAQAFEGVLKQYEMLIERIERVLTYTFLIFAQNTKRSELYAQYEIASNEVYENLVFFELEFCALESKIQKAFIKGAKHYSFYLKKLLQEKLSQTSQTNDSLQIIQKQKDSILTLNNELKQLQETNKIQKQRIETLSKAETKLSSLQPQYETAQNELIQLRTTINQLQNKLSNTEEKAKNLSNKDEVNLLKNEINSLKKELEGITEENKVLRNIGSKKGASKILNDIDKLRAKIAAYELNKEPYTPEELALLKSGERLHIGERLATQTDSNNNSPQSAPLFASPEARTITAEAIQKLQDRNGNFNEAERLLQRALALDENNIYILAHLALTELKLKKISEAESYLKKAYDLAPDNTFVLNLLGELYFHQNKYDNSFEILSQSYKLDPNNPDTLYQLGVVFAEKGLRDDAEKAFRKAIKLAPKYAEPHFNLAVIYATRNPAYPQLANFHYQKAVSLGLPRNMEFEKALQVSMENRTSNEK